MKETDTMQISVVVPVFNEAEVLPSTIAALTFILRELGHEYELIFIDDGSVDGTREILRNAADGDPSVKALLFSRNFGHQAAVTAGLDFASGDAVIVMDADLQDPPELLPKMIEAYQQGNDIVSAQRVGREGEGLVKLATARLFYWIMRKTVDDRLVPQVGDFRLFSRRAVDAIRQFREQHRFMRGLVAWLGLKEAIIPFVRQPRAAGESKYPLRKMIRFAWTAMTSFSGLPLRASLLGGGLLTSGGLLYMCYVFYATLVLHTTVSGWSSLICVQIIFNGAILMAIGLVGDYVARIFEECKGRPLYVLGSKINMSRTPRELPRVVELEPRPARPMAVAVPASDSLAVLETSR